MTSAQEELVLNNLPLVDWVAGRYRWLDPNWRPDLLQEGRLALVKAALKYNGKKGKFAGYASVAIGRKMRRFISAKWFQFYLLRGSLVKVITIEEAWFELVWKDRKHEEEDWVTQALAQLCPRRRQALIMRFGLYGGLRECKLHDIAVVYKCSRARAGQIVHKALVQLKYQLERFEKDAERNC